MHAADEAISFLLLLFPKLSLNAKAFEPFEARKKCEYEH